MSPAASDPTVGARRREVMLLAGYLVVFIIGVWTVVASELGAQEPASAHAEKVAIPTQKSR
jgi:S-adenosylmethionine hydrolase